MASHNIDSPSKVWIWIANLEGLAGIISFFVAPYWLPTETVGYIYAIFLLSYCITLFGYVLYLHGNKPMRYAVVPGYAHVAIHQARDLIHFLDESLNDDSLRPEVMQTNVDATIIAILDQIATCFSVLTGKRCAVCIKEMTNGKLIVTYRDTGSSVLRGIKSGRSHNIDEDTPCNQLFLEFPNQTDVYCCNDVVKEWQNNRYKSASFDTLGQPTVKELFGLRWVKSWPLKYSSCLTGPIRAMSKKPVLNNSTNQSHHGPSTYVGFLCVDCSSRGVFQPNKMADVLWIFTDILYILFARIENAMDELTAP